MSLSPSGFSLSRTTLLATVRPGAGLGRAAVAALFGSLILAASAQVSVPIGPVPMTMQSLVVVLIGMAYGWRLGGTTLALYLAEGAAGLPVFANFAATPALVGPTAGYLLGFVPAAALAGLMAERGWSRGIVRPALVGLAGHAVIFAAGLAWLATLMGPAKAIAVGFLPFVTGTLIKVALGAALMPAAWSLAPKK
jgi:biotin transport system substrate-specific component